MLKDWILEVVAELLSANIKVLKIASLLDDALIHISPGTQLGMFEGRGPIHKNGYTKTL